MQAPYVSMAHVVDVLERIAVRNAATRTLHADAAQRAHDEHQAEREAAAKATTEETP
jgi:hypothetical protein